MPSQDEIDRHLVEPSPAEREATENAEDLLRSASAKLKAMVNTDRDILVTALREIAAKARLTPYALGAPWDEGYRAGGHDAYVKCAEIAGTALAKVGWPLSEHRQATERSGGQRYDGTRTATRDDYRRLGDELFCCEPECALIGPPSVMVKQADGSWLCPKHDMARRASDA